MSYTSTMCKNLLVGVSGSIHSIHLPNYLYELRRKKIAENIKVIMTKRAAQMVQINTVELYTDDRVFVDLWDKSEEVRTPHINLAHWADLFAVLPASGDIIGKAANGIADDLLSSAILASPLPVIFAPAMNPTMWNSKAVKRNIQTLKDDGHYIIPPKSGISVTTGNWDLGLGTSLDDIIKHLSHVLLKRYKEDYFMEATSTPPKDPASLLKRA